MIFYVDYQNLSTFSNNNQIAYMSIVHEYISSFGNASHTTVNIKFVHGPT